MKIMSRWWCASAYSSLHPIITCEIQYGSFKLSGQENREKEEIHISLFIRSKLKCSKTIEPVIHIQLFIPPILPCILRSTLVSTNFQVRKWNVSFYYFDFFLWWSLYSAKQKWEQGISNADWAKRFTHTRSKIQCWIPYAAFFGEFVSFLWFSSEQQWKCSSVKGLIHSLRCMTRYN